MMRFVSLAMLLLCTCQSCLMDDDVIRNPATTPTSQPASVRLRLLGSPGDVTELQWQQRTKRIAWGRAFREMHVIVSDSTGRTFDLLAVNAFTIAQNGVITDIEVRPAWDYESQANLAGLIEQQLEIWQVPIRDEEKEFLDGMRRSKSKTVPRGALISRLSLRPTDDVILGVRIHGVYGKGWFAVFEFGVPFEKRPK